MSDTPIKTLGKYQIRGELGKGAMGVVYKGFDPALEREVAIKVMGGATVSDPELKKRFEQEAKASAKLQHPNIVTVFDFGYDDTGAPYMAMELLKGQDLEQRIRRNPLTFREKLDVVAQTCHGLAHAHKNGIVHRDIKPANIFITDSGEAKIMDFGVARLQQSSHTQTGAVLGTADYMSPEQIRGAKVDGRSDIFSAGVILYRLLTNKKPFTGENIQAVFFKVLNQEAPALVLPEGNEMPELQAIVDKALSKDVNERYASAEDLAQDIHDLIRLYQDVLNEDTVFDTMFDPSATVDMEGGSDGSGRRRTSGTGRILGTTGSGSRTHRPGTAYPTTSAGRSGVGRTGYGRTQAGRTTVSAPTRMMRPGTAAGTRPGVGIPLEESGSGFWKYAAVVVLLAGVGGGVYWFTGRGAPPEVVAGSSAVPAPAVPSVDIAAQFELAERSLEAGQLSQALNAVDAILFVEPENPEALALKARVKEEIDSMEAPPPVQVVQQPAQPPSARARTQGSPGSERATELAADASLALAAGNLAEASRLIQEGRRLDPDNSRWGQLEAQLRRAQEQSAQQRAAAERQAQVDRFMREATDYLKVQNYEAAIAAYDKALEVDPNNAQLINAKNMAAAAMRQAAAAAVTALAIEESKTQFIAPGQSDAPKGFEAGGGVRVRKATKAPENPAELIVQIHPTTVQPGDPYYLRVRIHNRGNRPILVKHLELISLFSGRATGKGQQLTPLVQRVNPRDTSLIWEVPGTWSEEQNQGSIQAIVTLAGNAKLVKTIRWK